MHPITHTHTKVGTTRGLKGLKRPLFQNLLEYGFLLMAKIKFKIWGFNLTENSVIGWVNEATEPSQDPT